MNDLELFGTIGIGRWTLDDDGCEDLVSRFSLRSWSVAVERQEGSRAASGREGGSVAVVVVVSVCRDCVFHHPSTVSFELVDVIIQVGG